MEMIHPDGLKEPRPPDFYDAENDEGGISSLADSSSAQDPQDPTPLHKVMEPMNGAVSGSRGKEVNGGAAPFSVDVAEELKSKSNDDLKADPSAKRKTPSSVNVLDAKFVPYQAPKAEVAAVQEPEVDAGPRTESQRLQSHVKTIVNDLMVAKGLHWLPEDRISLPVRLP